MRKSLKELVDNSEEWGRQLIQSIKSVRGVKGDTGKPPIFQGVLNLFPNAVEAVADVSAFGAKKYSWNNWKNVDDGVNRYTDAMIRHLLKESKGELLDAETNLLHACSVAWNALARLELMLIEYDRQKGS